MTPNVSLLEEVRKLQKDEENGTLVATSADKRLSVCYREGVIQSASLNLDTHRLGSYFVNHGLLTDKDVVRISADARRRHTVFGEAAVRGEYLEPAELADGVRRQAIDLLMYAFDNEMQVESFTKGVRSIYASAGVTVDHVLLEMARLNRSPLASDSARFFTLKTNESLSAVPWFPKELAILGELLVPASVETITQSTGLDEATVRLVLGVFTTLGIIETVGDEAEGPSSSSSGLPSPTRKVAFDRLVPVVTNAVIGEELEIVNNPSSFISEQFKTLKVRVRQDFQSPPRVLTITSPEQQDGKSLVSSNFALALSLESGRRTVIVDCDLRNPALDKYLGVPPDPGLIQHLSDGRLPPHCWMRRIGNLYFMAAGGISETPTELLSLRKMKDLIEILRNDFDTVILDAPPFSPIADAQIVSGLSDGVIMVVRSGKTSNRSIEQAFKVLDRKKLLGVVFNDVQPRLFNTYYARHNYGYAGDTRYGYSGRRIRSTTKGYLDS